MQVHAAKKSDAVYSLRTASGYRSRLSHTLLCCYKQFVYKLDLQALLYATANPSVCLSVTLRYCVKTRERMQGDVVFTIG